MYHTSQGSQLHHTCPSSPRVCLNSVGPFNPILHTDPEQTQRRSARFVKNDYTTRTPGCVTCMQDNLGWVTLQNRWLNNGLSMLYKTDHQLVDMKENYLQSSDSRTRKGHKFYQERTTSEVYRNSFFPRTVIDWNKLPHKVTAAESLEGFCVSLLAGPTSN